MLYGAMLQFCQNLATFLCQSSVWRLIPLAREALHVPFPHCAESSSREERCSIHHISRHLALCFQLVEPEDFLFAGILVEEVACLVEPGDGEDSGIFLQLGIAVPYAGLPLDLLDPFPFQLTYQIVVVDMSQELPALFACCARFQESFLITAVLIVIYCALNAAAGFGRW